MKPIKVEIFNGNIVEISENQELSQALLKINNAIAYITIQDVSNILTEKDYRNTYFMFRDILWDNDNRGYSKKEFHNVLKVACLSDLMGDEENYHCPASLSVKCLSLIGWKRFLDNLKEYAKDEFNIFL